MTTLIKSNAFMQYGTSNLTSRVIVIALVVFAHAAILAAWPLQKNASEVKTNQLSVSYAMMPQAMQTTISPQHKTTPAPVAMPEPVAEQATVSSLAQPAAEPMPSIAPATPVVADIEPDYKASYLNNPPPAYPMVARRNGLQGRVMLKVEVLAEGVCGQINIHQSSGYAMLDNAALQTVKNWHFTPARHAGQSVDRWFMIPIQFSLKDNAA